MMKSPAYPAHAARRARGVIVSVAIGVVLVAAASPVAARGPSPTAGSSPTNASSPTASSSPTGTVAPAIGLASVLSGYDRPVFVTSAKGNKRLFIVEQTGKIKVATRTSVNAPWVKAGTFLNLTGIVHDPNVSGGELGLLGLAFHPDYATNGLFYVYYTRASDDKDVLAEYHKQSALKADPGSARGVMATGDPANNHNGGWLGFGPDGYLYIAMGDGGGSPDGRPQDLDSRLGKILRIDPLDPPGSGRFSYPPDNPYVGAAGDDAVWAYWLRNPWRDSFDRLTGDLWLGDVGQNTHEEVDHLAAPNPGKGVNFGWDMCEGRHAYPGGGACTEAGTMLPQVEYDHSVTGDDNCSVTGGYVYRGTDEPSLYGTYFFGEYCSGRIWAIPTDFDMGAEPIPDTLPAPLDTALNISSFGEDARGELYVASLGGTIWRIVED